MSNTEGWEFEKIFKCNGETFGAMNDAEAWLKENGFSVGSTNRGYPQSIMFGDHVLLKYKNLSDEEKELLDGLLFADRLGDARVVLKKNPN